MLGETRERSVVMAIAVGEKIPEVQLMTMGNENPLPVSSTEALGHGKVVLFAVPGAFTPTCSDHHLPGFVVRADEIRAKGVDTIACLSVNDPFVMGAWGQDQKVGDLVLMLADGNGDFTKAVGLEMDGSGFGLGVRSQRYAAILEDGVVTSLFVERKPGLDVSSAESVLAAL
jgi:peroxiredoxin